MVRTFILPPVAIVLSVLFAAGAAADEIPKAQVMLIGVFHFANPGLDAVKSEVIDVKTAENQAYLEDLTDRIAAFQPTTVLLEYSREDETLINERYLQYQSGVYELVSPNPSSPPIDGPLDHCG